MIYLKKPANGATVTLSYDYQLDFTSPAERNKRSLLEADFKFDWTNIKIGVDREERSVPMPVRFEWMDRPFERGHNNRRIYTFLLISGSPDMSSPSVYTTAKSSFEVYNLKVSTKYYWCVQKNGRRSDVFSFTTSSALPRLIKIGGVSNVRDMGGYPSDLGGVIKQGLIYRGSEFENKMHISDVGVNDLLSLGIRTVVDLRGEASVSVDYPTALLLGLRRINVRGEAYECLFNPGQEEELHTFFTTFADPDNYPIYFHCRGGADRTGSYAFVLGALLGMSLDDLILDYEITSLSIWGTRLRKHKLFVPFLEAFMALEGKTLSEKARTFMKTHALMKDEDIEKIIEIAIEKK